MKIKTIQRDPQDYLRETKHDIHKMPRNYDPSAHPMATAREYVRALNATKLERVFAKPFITSLDGHSDGVSCMVAHPSSLTSVLSGSYDGELRMWDLTQHKCTRKVQAHTGHVRGVSVFPEPIAISGSADVASSSSSASQGNVCLSVGDDQNIRAWLLPTRHDERPDAWSTELWSVISRTSLLGVSCAWDAQKYAVCGEAVDVYDVNRTTAVRSFTWSADSHHSVAYAPIETTLLASLCADRSIVLYDSRADVPVKRVKMQLRSNQLAWNTQEAYTFTVANDDYNAYSFDMRRLDAPRNVHAGHTEAVTSICYAPTGREFVTGSYDKSIRIFGADAGHSRDVYHTKRMHRVQTVQWSGDNKYILSGSDEMNLRLWKANAAEKLGILKPREQRAAQYSAALRQKYGDMPQIKRISRHRQVPKHIYNASQEHRAIRTAAKRKEANVRAHSKPGSVPYVPERKKHVIKSDDGV